MNGLLAPAEALKVALAVVVALSFLLYRAVRERRIAERMLEQVALSKVQVLPAATKPLMQQIHRDHLQPQSPAIQTASSAAEALQATLRLRVAHHTVDGAPCHADRPNCPGCDAAERAFAHGTAGALGALRALRDGRMSEAFQLATKVLEHVLGPNAVAIDEFAELSQRTEAFVRAVIAAACPSPGCEPKPAAPQSPPVPR